MNVIVFGASGRCGSHFVRLAAADGHHVTAVVRSASSYEPPGGVVTVRGDVLEPAFVARAVSGHDAVMSGLGMRYRHPWSRRESPNDFTSSATTNIVRAMAASGVRRVSIISAAGVGDSRARANIVIQLMIAISNVGYAYADLERAERILAESRLDWQAVRPVTLTNRKGTGSVKVDGGFPMTASISREDVAAFMLRELEAPRFTERTPIIAGG